ncbi:hypothetical protein NQ318_018591 [Aromia moschata]|uniref:Uncharacterized protein n=1 Tax=Aromia moschata TaxID=1265417 RepID=A0AAV8ZHB1_9CUCU|nr:hypothetical protein NQ318_018591 [Aromia moschata]
MYGYKCLSRIQVFEWFKRFKETRETTEDDPRPGRPSTSKTDESVEKTGNIIQEDHRLYIRGLAKITGIDNESVRQILHDMVSKLFTPKQKESRMNICADILNNTDTEPGLLDTHVAVVHEYFILEYFTLAIAGVQCTCLTASEITVSPERSSVS